METSLEVLDKIERVTPPDGLYNKIMESVNNRVNLKLTYASVACIALLITINIFSFQSYNDNEVSSNRTDYLNISINLFSYE
tara:strand:+ start:264 stop:509 length:246 start_codon:yes stop_codon:yes gene_type:complete